MVTLLITIQACSFATRISDYKDFMTRKKQEGRGKKPKNQNKTRLIKNTFARRKDLQPFTKISKFSCLGKEELKTERI